MPLALRVRRVALRGLPLELADAPPEGRVLAEVAEVAAHGLLVAGHRLLLLAQRPREVDHRPVGLELRERELEDLPRALAAELVDEVHGHVVGRLEAGVQRVAATRGQRRDRLGVEAVDPLDDGVALDVDATTAGPAGQLRVLPRRDRHPCLAVELLELLEHHRTRRHVDAERERLGREDDLQELQLEELLHDLLEGRQHAGVVRRHPALQALEPLPVAEHREVLVAEHPCAFLHDRADLVALGRLGQADAGAEHLAHGLVAARAGEDEDDRGQQVLAVQQLDHLGALDAPAPLRRLVVPAAVATAAPARRPRGDRPPARPREALELGVHPVRRRLPRRVEQVDELRLDEHVLLERHGPVLGHDDVGVAAHGLQPVAELLGVRHRGAQRDEPHLLREVDDDLLPDRAAEPVGEVVHLVHHHVRQPVEQRRVGVEHVPQHLGGHHDDARTRVHVRVTREEADLGRAPLVGELLVLLVAERLDRRRVEDLRARLPHREEDGELGHDRLARTGRRRDEHAAILVERGAGGALERVQVEAEPRRELDESGFPALVASTRVSFGR